MKARSRKQDRSGGRWAGDPFQVPSTRTDCGRRRRWHGGAPARCGGRGLQRRVGPEVRDAGVPPYGIRGLTKGCDFATLCAMGMYDRDTLASRAGVERDFVDRLVDLGVLVPDVDDRLTDGDMRRAVIVHGLEQSGLPTTEVGTLIRKSVMTLDFV